MNDRRLAWFVGLMVPVFVWSAIGPHDRLTWFLEVAPVIVGVPLIFAVRARFPLSTLLLALVWVHAAILMVGGHYTYALVPAGEWAKEWFGWTRNNYDKLGHFAQGFVPAILTREVLLRTSPLGNLGGEWSKRRESVAAGDQPSLGLRPTGSGDRLGRPSRWLPFLVVSVCLAFSAFYELIEWWVALWSDEAADAFLGTQGYVWDTQSDMAWALGGATAALALLRGLHDRSIACIRDGRARTSS